EVEKLFTTATGTEIGLVLSVASLERTGWRQVPRSLTVRDGHNDEFRDLNIPVDAAAHELCDTTGGMKVRAAVQQVQHGISPRRESFVRVRFGQIDPITALLLQDFRLDVEPFANLDRTILGNSRDGCRLHQFSRATRPEG